MRDKKIINSINIIIYILLIGIIINLLVDKNLMIGKEKQVIKEMVEGEYESKLTELNTSHSNYALQVQENKKKLATAISNQKVETSENATIDEMVNNIGKILKNSTSDANATAEDIVEGKTAYVNGTKIIGTMENKGELNWNPTESTTYTVEPGYYSGGILDSSNASSMSIIKSYYNAAITQSSANVTIDQDVSKAIVIVFLAAGDNTQNAYTTTPTMTSSNSNTTITKLDDKSAKSYSSTYYSCAGRYTIFEANNIKSGDVLSFSYSADPATFTSVIVIG